MRDISNHGGIREGAGRKSKADEYRIKDLSIDALNEVFGSEEKAFEHIASKAKESFPHLKLLLEYAYGKPKENKNLGTMVEQPLFPDPEPLELDYSKLSTPALLELKALMEGNLNLE